MWVRMRDDETNNRGWPEEVAPAAAASGQILGHKFLCLLASRELRTSSGSWETAQTTGWERADIGESVAGDKELRSTNIRNSAVYIYTIRAPGARSTETISPVMSTPATLPRRTQTR